MKTKKTKIKKIEKKYAYKLIVKIGRTGKHDFEFDTDDPVASLLSIKIPKLTEKVDIFLHKDGKTATRRLMSFQGRRVFRDKYNAAWLIKTMHWILKPDKITKG